MTATLSTRQRNEAAVYDQRAHEWQATLTDQELVMDLATPPYPNREHVEFLDHLLAAIGDLTDRRIIEVGCGSGYLSTYLAAQGAQPTGVDVSEGMLEIAGRRARVNGVARRCTFRAEPIETLAEPDASFDAVIANQVLHHLELEPAMANIARLLRPGGMALFAEPVWLLPEWIRRLRYTGPVLRLFPSRADTPDERPLSRATVDLVASHFDEAEITPFQVTARLQNFGHLSDRTFARLQRADHAILHRVPFSDRFARYVGFVLTRRAATSPPQLTTPPRRAEGNP